MKKKVLVWLSGGVDSAVSAYLLKQAWYDVTAWFMINYLAPEGEYCPTLDDIKVAQEVAKYLEIPFFTFDYREEYEAKVLDYMYEWYQKGITPNPDIMCNKEVKFRVFLDEALALGFDMIAMGHYAQVIEKNGKKMLKKGKDPLKDQSYFLSGISQFQLSKSLFPIWHLDKNEVREIALKIWLPNALRKDSQGICFVGKVDLSSFLERKIEHKPGDILNTLGQKIWEHKWVFYYTIWQRKWLDLWGLKEPVFVIKKDIINNILIVGTTKDESLYGEELIISPLEIFDENISFPLSAKAKIRYRQSDQDCKVEILDDKKYKITFLQRQRAIAPGQICSIYDDDWVMLLSGVIE